MKLNEKGLEDKSGEGVVAVLIPPRRGHAPRTPMSKEGESHCVTVA